MQHRWWVYKICICCLFIDPTLLTLASLQPTTTLQCCLCDKASDKAWVTFQYFLYCVFSCSSSKGSEYFFYHYARKCWVCVEVVRGSTVVPGQNSLYLLPGLEPSCRVTPTSLCCQKRGQNVMESWDRMRKQESGEMQSANGVAHSASGMSWENRAASLMGSLLQQFDWKPSQPWPGVSVELDVFSSWFSWKVQRFSCAQLAGPCTGQHPINYTVLPKACADWKTWSAQIWQNCTISKTLVRLLQLCSFHITRHVAYTSKMCYVKSPKSKHVFCLLLHFMVQNDVCAEFDARWLFSHSSDEGEHFSPCSL